MSDKDSKFNMLAIGLVGGIAGYLIGKNFGSKIASEVKRVAENPEQLKENIEKFRDSSGEVLEEVKGKVTTLLEQLDNKLKAVDVILKEKNGEERSEQ